MQVEPAGSKKGFEVIYPLFYLNRHGRRCGPYGAEENVERAIRPNQPKALLELYFNFYFGLEKKGLIDYN
jgi:hypothetical protein